MGRACEDAKDRVAAPIMKMTRTTMTTVLDSDFIRHARPRRIPYHRYTLRPSQHVAACDCLATFWEVLSSLRTFSTLNPNASHIML
jgi:hypothetical protein